MTYLDQKFNDFEVGVNYPNLSLNMEEHGNSLVIFYGNEEKLLKKRSTEYYDYILWQILAIVNNI
jgi:hypothetical protein